MKRFFNLFLSLLFPPKCAACGSLLPPPLEGGEGDVLCEACLAEWEREIHLQCPACAQAYYQCRCMPKLMKHEGSVGLIKLSPYREWSESSVVRSVVLGMKKQPRTDLFSFCADELSHAVLETVKEENGGKLVIAHLPRSRAAERRYGFDQARELAVSLAAKTGVAHKDLLFRVREGKQQKKLSAREREENVKGAFSLVGEVTGYTVFLVDDVVTSGAGMSEAIRLLKAGGAKEVFPICVAYTVHGRGGNA